MSEMAVLKLIGTLSVLAVLIPLVKLGLTVWATARPRALIFEDEHGHFVKELSAEGVARIDNRELVALHERIRQKNDITVRAS